MTTTTQAPVTVPGSTAHTDGAWAVHPVQTRSERVWTGMTAQAPSVCAVEPGAVTGACVVAVI